MKRVSIILVLALTVILTSSMAYAKDLAGRFGMGANWFYYLSNEADFNSWDVENEGSPKAFNINASYCLPQATDPLNVLIRLDWEYISRDIADEEYTGGFSDEIGTVAMMPLMVNMQIRFANLGIITPYLGFGLGVSFNSISKGKQADQTEEEIERLFPGIDADLDMDIDNSFAFKVPIGMDIFITDNIALNLEAKYFYTNPEVKITAKINGLSNKESDEIDQSTFALGMGISVYF
jgi:outer membrane protein W